jgi:hypothetical protein
LSVKVEQLVAPFIYFAGTGQRVLFNYVGDEGAYCIIDGGRVYVAATPHFCSSRREKCTAFELQASKALFSNIIVCKYTTDEAVLRSLFSYPLNPLFTAKK